MTVQLLEHIMLQIADVVMVVSKPGEPYTGASPTLEPTSSLLRLQLVDKNFNDVLNGSAKLQRAMFFQIDMSSTELQERRLKASMNSRIANWEQYTARVSNPPALSVPALEWLFRKLRGNSSHPNFCLEDGSTQLFLDLSLKVISNWRTNHKKLMASGFGAKEASWRQIKDFQSRDPFEKSQTARIEIYICAVPWLAVLNTANGSSLTMAARWEKFSVLLAVRHVWECTFPSTMTAALRLISMELCINVPGISASIKCQMYWLLLSSLL